MDRQPPLTVSPRQLRRSHRSRPLLPPHASYSPPLPGRAPPVTRKQTRVTNRLSVSIAVESLPGVGSSRRLSLDPVALARKSGEYASAGTVAVGDGARIALFERGRFYEAYAARRNERLRMRKGAAFTSAAAEGRLAADPGAELARMRSSRTSGKWAKMSVQAPELPPSGRSRIQWSPVGAARTSREMKGMPWFAPGASASAAASSADCCAACGTRVGTSGSVRRL